MDDLKFRVEKRTVVRNTWGPGDTYLTAGYGGSQVYGFKEGDVIYRYVSEWKKDEN